MMIYIIISVVATALIVFLIMHQSKGKQKAMLEKEYMSKQAEDANRLKASFDEQLQTLTNEKVEAEKQLAVTLSELEQSTRHNEKMREELEKQFQQRLNLMREEMKSMAEQMLKETRSELNNADRERLDALIAPLKERMETFSKAVNDNNRDNATHKTEIKTAFEAAMKQLHEEQERTVKELKEQTQEDTVAQDPEKEQQQANLKETLRKIKESVAEEDPKPSQQLTLRTILGGDLLTTEMVRSQIWLFVMIVAFCIAYVAFRYQCQQDMLTIDRMENELKDAKFKALSSSSTLTEKCRESHVLDILKQNQDSLLHQADQPPYIIAVPEE